MSTNKPQPTSPIVPTAKLDLAHLASLAAIQLDACLRGEQADVEPMKQLAEALKNQMEEGFGAVKGGQAARLVDPATVSLFSRSLGVGSMTASVSDLPSAIEPRIQQLTGHPKDLSKADLEGLRDFAVRVSAAARRPATARRPAGPNR